MPTLMVEWFDLPVNTPSVMQQELLALYIIRVNVHRGLVLADVVDVVIVELSTDTHGPLG